MRKLLFVSFCLSVSLFFSGCAHTTNIEENIAVAKQENYINHTGLSSISNEEVVLNYEDDACGKGIMKNLVFDFKIENDRVCLVFDKICDGLSDYDTVGANAEKSRLESKRKQIEYEASLLSANGDKVGAENKLQEAKFDYRYIKVGEYLVNVDEYIDIATENSKDMLFDFNVNKNNEEYIFTSNGEFAKKFLTAGTIKSTVYGKYKLNNNVVYINIDKTIKEIQGEITEIKSNISTVGYFENGKLFYDILALKK